MCYIRPHLSVFLSRLPLDPDATTTGAASMSAQAHLARANTLPTDTNLLASPIQLLDLIVRLTAGTAVRPTCEPRPFVQEILFEADFDGTTYQVVRLLETKSLLSARESQVARLIAQGHPNKVIADTLGLSYWTVCSYIRRIFSKLDVTSRSAIASKLAQDRSVAGAGVR